MQTFNITSATTTTLRDLHANIGGSIRSIQLANTHASTAVTIDLFLEDSSSNKTYIIKTDIPGQVTLRLDSGLSFNSKLFALKLTTSAGGLATSTPLSVIIK